MAYVTVPKDLTKIKSKMLFGLTKRQLVCFGSAALVGVPLFFLSKGSTVLENFPLFCPKCKQETLINVKQLNMSVIKEPVTADGNRIL